MYICILNCGIISLIVDIGKKGKKKGTVIPLQSFLASNGTPVPSGTTQVAKKIRNVDGEDSDDSTALPLIYQLPTAPRANRISNDESIPQNPPFVAYITNLLFDVNENDVYEYFEAYQVKSVRLPRDEDGNGRSRGFGYVEFETRDDLISVLSLPDPSIKGRRIRIDYTTDSEQNGNRHKGGGRRGYESSSSGDMSNWRRSGQQSGFDSNRYDKGFNRNWNSSSGGSNNNNGESWRSGTREPRDRDSAAPFTRKRDAVEQERPKLNLKPRTLPLPERDTSSLNSGEMQSSNVFGAAKPVDTSARDLEIEQKLAETRKITQEQEIATSMKNVKIDDSGEKKTAISNPSNWRRTEKNVESKSEE